METEQTIGKWNDGAVVLTTARIRGTAFEAFFAPAMFAQKKGTGFRSIFLQNVTSVDFVKAGENWLLFLSAFAVFAGFGFGFLNHSNFPVFGGFGFGFVFFGLFFFNRTAVIRISSFSGSIVIDAEKMDRTTAMNQIEVIEKTIQHRVRFLNTGVATPAFTANPKVQQPTAAKGFKVAEPKVKCSTCQTENEVDSAFCENCGQKLTATAN